MQTLEIQPIPNEPALFIDGKKILVVADLHIGIEAGLMEHGLITASQTNSMIKHLMTLLRKQRPKEIIILEILNITYLLLRYKKEKM